MIHLETDLASWTHRKAPGVVLIFLLVLAGCKSGSSIDRTASQKVSDSFMGYLASDRVNDARS